MQSEKSQSKGKRIMLEPRFRHYPFTLGSGFLGLDRGPMADSIYPVHNANKTMKEKKAKYDRKKAKQIKTSEKPKASSFQSGRGQCFTITLLHMNRLSKTESSFFASLICSLLPEDLYSKLILSFIES